MAAPLHRHTSAWSSRQALSTGVQPAETSTHLESAWRQALCTGVPPPETSTHIESASALHSSVEPQACSISRSFVAAPLQRHTHLQVHKCVAVSTLHRSATARDEHAPWVRLRLAPWSSRTLARSFGASSWRLRCKGTFACTCTSAWQQALCTGVPPPETSTHIESASALHRGVELQAWSTSRSFVVAAPLQRHTHLQVHKCVVLAASTLHRSATATDEHAP